MKIYDLSFILKSVETINYSLTILTSAEFNTKKYNVNRELKYFDKYIVK